MLVFNEGVPRSGKSYDAVSSHILPALKAGRRVFARLNGLDHDKIAAHLGMEPAAVRDLLIVVTTAEVKSLFVAVAPVEGGEWTISNVLKNALFIVDECHEFYVADRAPISPAIENFFALCGQNGMDGLLLSQFYKRLHSSLRARIERKNVFQKLTAVGFKNKYTVRRFHAMGPDRFELVGTDTETYNPLIFPLYKGYADGADNVAVYTAGGKTVWAKIGKYAIFVIPIVGIGIWSFARFFSGHSGLIKEPPKAAVPMTQVAPVSPLQVQRLQNASTAQAAESSRSLVKHVDTSGMPSGVAYVFSLCDRARPRLAGLITGGAKVVGMVEWVQDGGKVLDRLSLDDVKALGVTVEVNSYGVRLVYEKKDAIVTPWPLDVPADPGVRDSGQGDQRSVAQSSKREPDLSAGDGRQWPQSTITKPYTPPQLMPSEEASNWRPSHG